MVPAALSEDPKFRSHRVRQLTFSSPRGPDASSLHGHLHPHADPYSYTQLKIQISTLKSCKASAKEYIKLKIMMNSEAEGERRRKMRLGRGSPGDDGVRDVVTWARFCF